MLLLISPCVCSNYKAELAKLKVKQSYFENDTLSANGPRSRVTTRHPIAQPVCWSGAAVPGALCTGTLAWGQTRVPRHLAPATSHCHWRADMMKSASGLLAAPPCPFPLHKSRTFRKKIKNHRKNFILLCDSMSGQKTWANASEICISELFFSAS